MCCCGCGLGLADWPGAQPATTPPGVDIGIGKDDTASLTPVNAQATGPGHTGSGLFVRLLALIGLAADPAKVHPL